MFEKAENQKQITVVNSVRKIQEKINEATQKGLNQTRLFGSSYYMGSEVTEALKEAGYNITSEKSSTSDERIYTVSW